MKPDTVSDPGQPARPGGGLARSAGVTGVATLASRILGLVRDQVLAAFFGAGNEMDAFIVAFRIPNLVRDLFAEGAMSAAFVPTFTRQLTLEGKATRWRLGNNVLNALLIVDRRAGRARDRLRAAAGRRSTPATSRSVPGKLELTVQLTRVMLPFLTLVAVAAVVMGMLNSLHHYFVPALSPAMFNVATIAVRVRARAADAGARAAADHGDRDRGAGRRRRPDRDPVAGAAARGLPLSRRSSIRAIRRCGGC